jgi:hypothetical protein
MNAKTSRNVTIIVIIAIVILAIAMMLSKLLMTPASAVTAQSGDCRDLRRACELKTNSVRKMKIIAASTGNYVAGLTLHASTACSYRMPVYGRKKCV